MKDGNKKHLEGIREQEIPLNRYEIAPKLKFYFLIDSRKKLESDEVAKTHKIIDKINSYSKAGKEELEGIKKLSI